MSGAFKYLFDMVLDRWTSSVRDRSRYGRGGRFSFSSIFFSSFPPENTVSNLK
ncbi:MAG: hypothetical protein ACPLRX_04820 [Candidatus Saccharicenans sp.]